MAFATKLTKLAFYVWLHLSWTVGLFAASKLLYELLVNGFCNVMG